MRCPRVLHTPHIYIAHNAHEYKHTHAGSEVCLKSGKLQIVTVRSEVCLKSDKLQILTVRSEVCLKSDKLQIVDLQSDSL